MDTQFINEKSVSELTGISIGALRKHRLKRVGLPYYKVGRLVRYEVGDILSFMKEAKIVTQKLQV